MAERRRLAERDLRDLVESNYDDVLAYCRRHTMSLHDAQDIAQETFLRLVSRSTAYRDDGRPLAYLLTIARNLCIDAARSRYAAVVTLEGESMETIEAASPACGTDTPVYESLDIAAALAALPEDLREVVELRFDQDLGIGDIAAVVGISRFSVRRRLEAAFGMLRETLGADYLAPGTGISR